MVDQVDKEQEAVDYFKYLLEDDNPEECDRELSAALKSFANKHHQHVMEGTKNPDGWHNYFVMGLKKFVRDMPSTTTDLDKALAALNREEVAADARARGVNIQILPGPLAGNDKTPKAPAPHQNGMDKTSKAPNQNVNGSANAKRPAENQAEGKSSAATEAQDRPTKRVKHGGEDITTSSGFTVETEGSMSLTVRISDDARTSTFNLNGRGPAVVTVNVQKKATSALASTNANGNKEAKKEGAA